MYWRYISFLLVGITAAVAASNGAQPEAGKLWIGLDRAGAPKGLAFEEASERQVVYFPLPSDTPRQSGTLELLLRWSPMLREPSNVRVSIGDLTAKVIPLTFGTNDTVRVEVPLAPADLIGRFLRVTFAVAASTSHEMCIDERLRSGFLQVLPDSGLRLDIGDAPPSTVRAFFDRLPRRVTLSLTAQPPTAEMVHAALQMAVLLRETGHLVEVAHLPDAGDIAIGPEAEVAAATASLSGPDQEQIRVRQTPKGSVLTITEPYSIAKTGILQSAWLGLAATEAYAGVAGLVSADKGTADKSIAFSLESLTSGSTLRETASRAEWSLHPDPRLLPAGYRINRVVLRVAQAPGLQQLPVLLYVYANGTLLRTIRLSDDGEPHSFNVDVPSSALQGSSSATIRVVSQRIVQTGQCSGVQPALPIQLLPGTALVAAKASVLPRTLRDAGPELRAGFELYLDRSSEGQESRLLLLADVLRQLEVDPALAVVRLIDAGEKITPVHPFVLVSRAAPSGLESPVRFDNGRVQVVTADGRTLLDATHLTGISVLQLTRSNQQNGLWIRPAKLSTPIEEVDLGTGDAAFLDGSGLVRSFDSHQLEVEHVRYPDLTTWADWLRQYQLWLFGAVWLLFSFLFVGLYRKVMQRKDIV